MSYLHESVWHIYYSERTVLMIPAVLFGDPPVSRVNAPLKKVMLPDIVKKIKTDKKLADATKKIRAEDDKLKRKTLKSQLLSWIMPFNYSKMERASKHFISSELMIFEADQVTASELARVREQAVQHPMALLVYTSVSGNGFKIMVKCDMAVDAEYYVRAYNVLRLQLGDQLGVKLDPANKDFARVQYLAYDPDVYMNLKAKPASLKEIVKHLKAIDKAPRDRPSNDTLDFSADDIENAITHAREHGFLEMKSEQDWWEMSMSLASLGEEGRKYFIQLSEDHPLYPEDTEAALNKRFDQLLASHGHYHDESRVLNMNAFFNKIEKLFGYRSPRREGARVGLEYTLADRFTEQHQGLLLYDHSQASKPVIQGWFAWDGRRFAPQERGEISEYYRRFTQQERVLAMARAAERDGSANEEGEQVPGTLTMGQVGRAETMKMRDLTLRWSRNTNALGCVPAQLDRSLDLINVLNGTLDLSNGQLRPHDPADRITKLVDCDYDPVAKCPRWEEFIRKIFLDNEELVAYVQEAVGYSLTGHTSEDCIFFLYGTGANGKSTLIDGLKLILGEYQTQANYETFVNKRDSGGGSSHSEDVVRLKGARLVVASEINASQTINDARLKQMTGGDMIKARDLYATSIEFKPHFKLWIAGNHKPKLENFDDGIRRRIKIIPFKYKFEKAEIRSRHAIIEEFKSERDGIFQWAVEGALRWRKRGRLMEPELVQATTEEYFVDSNATESFIRTFCEAGEGYQVEAKVLYQSFIDDAQDGSDVRLSKRQFLARLEELRYPHRNGAGNKVYVFGLRLKGKNTETSATKRVAQSADVFSKKN
jgi:P4 family phage/plasmid primase-like protien